MAQIIYKFILLGHRSPEEVRPQLAEIAPPHKGPWDTVPAGWLGLPALTIPDPSLGPHFRERPGAASRLLLGLHLAFRGLPVQSPHPAPSPSALPVSDVTDN